MKTKTALYNPLDYLETDEEIAQYLNNAYMNDDPEVFVIALGYLAKARGVANVAKASGLNRESLYKVFSGKSKPRWSTIQGVMKALNVRIQAVA